MKFMDMAAYVFWGAASAFLMRFELRTDDTGVMALFILVTNLILGSLHPQRAWQWALMVGICIPAADLIFGAQQRAVSVADAGKILLFVIPIGLIGAYLGVLLRKTFSAAADLYH